MNRRWFLQLVAGALAAEALDARLATGKVFSFPSKIKIARETEVLAFIESTAQGRYAWMPYGPMLDVSSPEMARRIVLGMMADRRQQESQLAKEIWTNGYSYDNRSQTTQQGS